jgi:hypothetical protein
MIGGVNVLVPHRLARWRPGMDTSMSCSGREPMGAIGTNGHARTRPKTETSISCSGREPMGVIGMLKIVLTVLAAAAIARSLTGLIL